MTILHYGRVAVDRSQDSSFPGDLSIPGKRSRACANGKRGTLRIDPACPIFPRQCLALQSMLDFRIGLMYSREYSCAREDSD